MNETHKPVSDLKDQFRSGVSRRSFVRRAAVGAALLPLSGFFASAVSSLGQSTGATSGSAPTQGDIDILNFLAAAELLETDLWSQYCELAVGNPEYREALERIDPALINYICADRENELSHANFINAYLVSIGQPAVNLDPFRTLPSSTATGAKQIGRLTSLFSLTLDTSWYSRYRGHGNPDFGDTFRQVATIVNQPAIPEKDGQSNLKVKAESAAFHFCSIEQGGASLYDSFLTKVSSLDVLSIVGSIGPIEFYQFGTFQTSLQGITGATSQTGTVIPNLSERANVRDSIPEECTFFKQSLPLCGVLRPRSTAKAGAVATATGLVASGLFTGQSQAFFDAVVGLATAADAAVRTC